MSDKGMDVLGQELEAVRPGWIGHQGISRPSSSPEPRPPPTGTHTPGRSGRAAPGPKGPSPPPSPTRTPGQRTGRCSPFPGPCSPQNRSPDTEEGRGAEEAPLTLTPVNDRRGCRPSPAGPHTPNPFCCFPGKRRISGGRPQAPTSLLAQAAALLVGRVPPPTSTARVPAPLICARRPLPVTAKCPTGTRGPR